jgi:hypothetical protein
MKSLLLTFFVFSNVRKFCALGTFQSDLKVLRRIIKLCTPELDRVSCQTGHSAVFALFKMSRHVCARIPMQILMPMYS